MKKRLLSLVLTVIMLIGMLPMAAFAAEGDGEGAQVLPDVPAGIAKATLLDVSQLPEDCPLTFALNFTFDSNIIAELEENGTLNALVAAYADYYVDFELTVNKDVTFNANGTANGYLGGQYDGYSTNWLKVPFEDVSLKAGESIEIMKYAASKFGTNLFQTVNSIAAVVQDFDCGVFFTKEYLNANPDLEVTLKLNIYKPDSTGENSPYGDPITLGTYVFSNPNNGFSVVIPDSFTTGTEDAFKAIVNEIGDNKALKADNYNPIAGHNDVADLTVTLSDVEMTNNVPTKIVFTVVPADAYGVKVSNPSSAITFRLPIPDCIVDAGYTTVQVYHDGELMSSTYTILGSAGGYYIEVTSATFSEFTVEPVDVDEPAAVNVAEVNGTGYEALQAAINAASTGDTVKLLQDISLTENDCVENADRKVLFDVVDKDITLNMNGKKISVVHEDAFTNEYIVAVVRVADGAGLTVTGNGTIDVKVLAENPDIAYMFWKRGTTGHLTIENGTYHMNDSADSMVYTNGNEIVNIKGGTWTLDAYGTRSNREPWIFNVQGAGDNHVVVTGGTFNADINRQYWSNEVVVPETHYTVDNGDGTWTVEEGAVAYVNEGMLTGPYFVRKNIGYATLADAVNAADDNETVTLLQDITLTKGTDSEQYVKKQITIDLNGYTLTSTGMRTLVAYGSNAELTVQNGTISSDTSGALTATYNGKLILGKDLTVTSTGNYGLYVNRGKLEVPAGTTGLSVKGATKAIWYKAHDDNEMYVAAGKYSTAPIGLAEGYGVVVNSGWYEVIAPVQYINEEGQLSSAANLQEAIDNAADGSTITLNTDFYLYANKLTSKAKTEGTDLVAVDGQYGAFFLVEEKTLTIDLNGHNLLGYTRSAPTMVIGMFVTDNNGHLTLKDSVGDALVRITAQNANVYALITNYEDDCSITIEGGTYKLDKASDSLIYSAASANEGEGDQGIVVNGGTFELGNIGTGANYGPWIFNAKGQNHRHVWVTGGTFNADINHQYWTFEAQLPETLAVKANGDGTWTVVEAVAYVTESHGSFVKNVGYATMEEAEAGLEGAYRPYTYYKQPSADEKIVLLTEISTSDDLQNVVSGSDVVVNVTLAAGSYTMPTTSGDITISGTKDTVISGNDATAKNVTFEGVTIQSTGAAYTGIKHSEKVVYNGVTIIGNMYLYAKEVVFENCTFDLSGTNDYIWVYGATNVTFKNCTFNTMGKAILVFQDGSQVDQTVTVESCTFNASQAANTWNGIHISAVSIDGSQGGTYNVILNNNTVDSDFNGLWQDKTGAGNITVTVDGTTELSAN